MGTKKIIEQVKTLHVNHEVLAASVLHLSPEEQAKVNKLALKVLGLSGNCSSAAIMKKRQKMVDACNAYDVIIDAFALVEKLASALDQELSMSDNTSLESYEILADAKMFLGSIKDEK